MPRPGPAAGFDKITHPQKRAVLLAYAGSMRVNHAMQAAKISRTHHYHWLKTDPDYKAAFAEARAMAADVLEDEAVRRAIGTTEGASDTMLIFLLKGAKPETYKERYEHTGAGGGPIQVQNLPPDARQARLAALLAKRSNGHAEPVTPDAGSPS